MLGCDAFVVDPELDDLAANQWRFAAEGAGALMQLRLLELPCCLWCYFGLAEVCLKLMKTDLGLVLLGWLAVLPKTTEPRQRQRWRKSGGNVMQAVDGAGTQPLSSCFPPPCLTGPVRSGLSVATPHLAQERPPAVTEREGQVVT